MRTRTVTPILNVSDVPASLEWFARLGWSHSWSWGEPVGFACVRSGECEIFLCLDAQGGRGRGSNRATFGPGGDETADRGVWLSVWVEDVDAVHRDCVRAELEVMFEPADLPWGVRELHVRHPDGHVFRIGQETRE